MKSTDEITLTGRIQRITFHSSHTHFTIAKFKTIDQDRVITILGHIVSPNVGEKLMIKGGWETHPKFGPQLKLTHTEVMIPSHVDEMKAYLTSGFIKGLRERTAEKMVETFGEKLPEIIETDPDQLLTISGIGEKTARHIKDSWHMHHFVRNLMKFLQEKGLPSWYYAKILKTYGTEALEVLEQTPYQVAEDIPKIGFLIADAIYKHTGSEMNTEDRARSCILYLLGVASERGHMFMWDHELIQKCSESFQLDIEMVETALYALSKNDDVIIESIDGYPDSAAIYLKNYHGAETAAAHHFQAMLSLPSEPFEPDSDDIMSFATNEMDLHLSDSQKKVLSRLMADRLSILTGGPGTGKTTLIRCMARIMRIKRERLVLTAPTGRAAQRISELSGKRALTIHRLLGYQAEEGMFERDQENPIECDAVIIDEASMVDAILLHHLLKAIPVTARLIFVGDVFQLPSVGPGNILGDMIESGVIPSYELTEIFRQHQESAIIINAHRVRCGEPLQLPKVQKGQWDDVSDFYFMESSDPAQISEKIVDLCLHDIPERFDIDPIKDIQVITPMHKGPVGTISLNQRLQVSLNLHEDSIDLFGTLFKVDDKVMQLKNNYQKEVFNGEIGIIQSVDRAQESIHVRYESKEVQYTLMDIDEISLAYAITVHKSQGSEYPVIVIPLTTQHYILLQRNLLYTAITRARKCVVLVGTQKALNIALKNNRTSNRRTAFSHRLTSS